VVSCLESFNQKLSQALGYLGMSQADLARKMYGADSASPAQRLSSKLKTAKYSQEDFDMIGRAIGAEIEISIKFPDGKTI